MYRRPPLHMLNPGLAPHRIDAESDAVFSALGLDRGLAAVAIERERHGEQTLQRVALRATGWRDIGLAA